MMPTRMALYGLILLSFIGIPAAALDLNEARENGWLVAEALDVGSSGDWSAAEQMVAGEDAVIRDIVLWRKLRANKGTYDEYEAYRGRRGTWPGQSQLEDIYLGASASGGGSVMSEDARANWRRFVDLYGSKQYDDAEVFLSQISTSYDALGDPSRWSDRRRRLARRAARLGEGRLAYDIASRHYLSALDGYAYSDLEWISGWVALRQLNEPGRAAGHFESFAASVKTPISLGRAGYWTGRAYEALGDQAAARRWFSMGANYQTSFYGQLAAAKIGASGDVRIANGALRDWRSNP
ncbi:MAG: hypothetical protein AAGA26_11110, partial [Pseudomonadota bacterium]